jgi:hypothetical protein
LLYLSAKRPITIHQFTCERALDFQHELDDSDGVHIPGVDVVEQIDIDIMGNLPSTTNPYFSYSLIASLLSDRAKKYNPKRPKS